MLLLVAILLIAAIVRLYNLGALALWHDEAFSVLYIQYPWTEMMRRIALDVHPPLYYIVLRIWSAFGGYSEMGLRTLSVIFGVLTVWATFDFTREAFGDVKRARYAALLVALNPFQAQFALEARMYTLGTFLIMLSSYLLLKALATNRRTLWIWFAIVAAACLYTHYFLLFSIAAQGLYAVYVVLRNSAGDIRTAIRTSTARHAALAGTLVVALYLPWLPIFVRHARMVRDSFWIPPLERWAVPLTLWKMIFGGQHVADPVIVLMPVVLVLVLALFVSRTRDASKWFVLLSIITPLAAALAVTWQTPIYLDRYFVFASLFVSVAIAATIMSVHRSTLRHGLAIAMVIASAGMFLKNWQDLAIRDSLWGAAAAKRPRGLARTVNDQSFIADRLFGMGANNRPGMRGVAQVVNDRAFMGDRLYIGSSFAFFTFKYYNHTSLRPLLYSDRPLNAMPHWRGTALLTEADLIRDFTETPPKTRVWLVWSTLGGDNSRPDVPASWTIVREHEFRDAPDSRGKVGVAEYLTH
jgi:uncharacterized membrane protein